MAPSPRRGRGTDREQAGLPLFLADADAVPRLVDPEASIPCAAPFDGDDWLFAIDWDGSRCVLSADGMGRSRLNGFSANLAARFPEIAAAAALLQPGTVLDGVICVLDAQGRPDLPGLCRRMAGGQPRPAVYLATDLLFSQGDSQLGRPLSERLTLLAAAVPGESRVQVPDCVDGHGVSLAAAAEDRGLSAIVARRRTAPYRSGVASPDRLRIDLAGRRDVIVVGFQELRDALEAVLAEWIDGKLAVIGVATIDDPAAVRWFHQVADPVTAAPVADPSRAGAGTRWVRPRLTAAVEALRVPAGSLKVVGLRDDIDPRWCMRRAAVPPPAAAAVSPMRPFSPTVLRPLPLDAA